MQPHRDTSLSPLSQKLNSKTLQTAATRHTHASNLHGQKKPSPRSTRRRLTQAAALGPLQLPRGVGGWPSARCVIVRRLRLLARGQRAHNTKSRGRRRSSTGGTPFIVNTIIARHETSELDGDQRHHYHQSQARSQGCSLELNPALRQVLRSHTFKSTVI